MVLDIQKIQSEQITQKTNFLKKYRDPKLFYKEENGDSLLNSFIIHLDMKNFYPMQVIDIKLHFYYIALQKSTHFEEHEAAPEHTNLYVIMIKHKEIKMVADGNKKTGIYLI